MGCKDKTSSWHLNWFSDGVLNNATLYIELIIVFINIYQSQEPVVIM